MTVGIGSPHDSEGFGVVSGGNGYHDRLNSARKLTGSSGDDCRQWPIGSIEDPNW